MPADDGNGRRLRSRRWFDNPHNPAMTALYLERYMNYGLTPEELQRRQADHRHRADRVRSLAVQPPPYRAGAARAGRHPRGRRRAAGISDPSDPGNRQAPDRGARPQPRVSEPGRGAARLSDRRRGADDRLRQDDARVPDGRGDGEHSRDRAVGRADAGRLVAGEACPVPAPSSGKVGNSSPRARSATRSSCRWWRRRRHRSGTATRWARRAR